MSGISELLQHQIASAAWANQRILAASATLTLAELEHDFKTSDHSILGTLVHIYRAERMWLARLEGQNAAFKTEGDNALPFLLQNWRLLSARWQSVAGLNEESIVTYRDLKDKTWTHPLWKIVLHVVNHSTHHRGQVSGFLRALGHTPPNTDSITFSREQSGHVA